MTDRQPPSSDHELLTADDVAPMLGMSKRTLQRMSHRGEGPPHVPFRGTRGVTFRYPRAGVLRWIEQNTVLTADAP